MASNSQLEALLDVLYSANRYRIINIICQTLLYGIYSCLVPIVVHVMVTNGLQSRARKWLFAMITSMFALSTLHWIFSVTFTFVIVDLVNNDVKACYGRDNPYVCLARELAAKRGPTGSYLSLFNDILLINYIIADIVVVWRAWALCSDQRRAILMIPVVMLGINTVIYLMIVVLRSIELVAVGEGKTPNTLFNMMDIVQVAHLAFSLLINISATSIIALKAWKCRKFLMESGTGIRTSTQAIRILALLAESGMIYILIGVTNLVSIIIFLHYGLGQIASVFMPMGTQLVGIYPIVVVLLVEKNRSLNTTLAYSSFGTLIDIRRDGPSPMRFAPGPVLVSGGQIDLSMKPSSTDIHVAFDHTLEPGGAGISAGSSKVSSEDNAGF